VFPLDPRDKVKPSPAVIYPNAAQVESRVNLDGYKTNYSTRHHLLSGLHRKVTTHVFSDMHAQH
jgi:hypothetical protein